RTYDGNLNDLASITLAPAATPMYATDYKGFAPRFGMAAVLHNEPGQELVLRAGGGLFYGTGQSFANVFGVGHGLGAGYSLIYSATATPTSFSKSYPIPPSQVNDYIPPIAPPYTLGFVVARDYTPPKALQWSVALEQAIGKAQSITLSYVGTDAPLLGHWAYY